MSFKIHPRITAKRSEITEDDVRAAFIATLRRVPRIDVDPIQWVGVGIDNRGRLLEWVAVENQSGEWLVFHAMQATTNVLIEIGLRER